MSMSTASNWLWNFGIGYATPYLVDSGPGRAGLGSSVYCECDYHCTPPSLLHLAHACDAVIWGGCCVGCIVFVFFFIYETKSLSLEQVDILYR